MAARALPEGIARVLVTEGEIEERMRTLADEILTCYEGEPEVLVLGVLSGCVVFLADLVRAMHARAERRAGAGAGGGDGRAGPAGPTTRVKMDFIRAESYTGATTVRAPGVGGGGGGGGADAAGAAGAIFRTMKAGNGGARALEGKHVILVDDIVDTGRTLEAISSAIEGASTPRTRRPRRRPGGAGGERFERRMEGRIILPARRHEAGDQRGRGRPPIGQPCPPAVGAPSATTRGRRTQCCPSTAAGKRPARPPGPGFRARAGPRRPTARGAAR